MISAFTPTRQRAVIISQKETKTNLEIELVDLT